jgi:hypothetical protein
MDDLLCSEFRGTAALTAVRSVRLLFARAGQHTQPHSRAGKEESGRDLDPAESRILEPETIMLDQFYQDGTHDTDPNASLRRFAEARRDALFHAGERLGGRRGTRLVLDALDGLSSEFVLSRRTRDRFVSLLDLLSLEHVHDETREEAFRFACIDPCDPIVEEICLLADELRAALARWAVDRHPMPQLAAG